MAKAKPGKDQPTIIKKYANRRLYDTGRSSYVTLDDLYEMVQEKHNFIVIDAKSGDDITRSILTQIIADHESTEETLLPTSFLKDLIGLYGGNNMQNMLPTYLEQSMNMFVQNQEKMQEQISKSFEGMGISGMENIFPQNSTLEEMTRKNMEMFERTMKMMPPFNMGFGASDDADTKK